MSEFKFVRIGNSQNWKLSELEVVRIGNCQNWKLSELKIVRIGICQNWNLSEFAIIHGAQNALEISLDAQFKLDVKYHQKKLYRNHCAQPLIWHVLKL